MASEFDPQSYHPSHKLRLVVRFEELGTGVLDGKAPAKSVLALNGVKDDRAPLVVQREVDPFDGITRLVLVSAGAQGSKATTAPTVSSDNYTYEITGIVPKTVNWKVNGIRSADTLSATIRWQDFPFDPILIRSCAVEFYLGTVTAEEFAAGVAGLTRGDVFGQGVPNESDPMNLVPDTYLDSQGRRRTNLRFQGWLDKYKLNSKTSLLATMECTDNTRLLIKQPAPPSLVLSNELPIDEAVAQYLSHFPQMEGLRVLYQPSSAARTATNPPRLKNSLGPQAYRPKLGPAPSKGSGSDQKLSVFDYITDVCGAMGHIVYVDGVTLIIRQPRTLLNNESQPREDDPYRTRHLESGDYPDRTFIVGRNVEGWEVSRDFASETEPKNIEVRCFNPRTKSTLVARWPSKVAGRVTTSQPGDGKADEDWKVITVSGIESQDVLLDIAQSNYELQRRQINVEMETRNLSTFGGNNEDPDILDVRVGDRIMVLRNASGDSTLGDTEEAMSAESTASKKLLSLGYSQELSNFYGRLVQNKGIQAGFRLREAEFTSDIESGVNIKLQLSNFLEVRLDREAPTPDGQSPTAPKTGNIPP